MFFLNKNSLERIVKKSGNGPYYDLTNFSQDNDLSDIMLFAINKANIAVLLNEYKNNNKDYLNLAVSLYIFTMMANAINNKDDEISTKNALKFYKSYDLNKFNLNYNTLELFTLNVDKLENVLLQINEQDIEDFIQIVTLSLSNLPQSANYQNKIADVIEPMIYYLENETDERILHVLSVIKTEQMAYEFLMCNLDAARNGASKAQDFVKKCGFLPEEYIRALYRYDEVASDILASYFTKILNSEARLDFNLKALDIVMNKFKLGNYSQKG